MVICAALFVVVKCAAVLASDIATHTALELSGASPASATSSPVLERRQVSAQGRAPSVAARRAPPTVFELIEAYNKPIVCPPATYFVGMYCRYPTGTGREYALNCKPLDPVGFFTIGAAIHRVSVLCPIAYLCTALPYDGKRRLGHWVPGEDSGAPPAIACVPSANPCGRRKKTDSEGESQGRFDAKRPRKSGGNGLVSGLSTSSDQACGSSSPPIRTRGGEDWDPSQVLVWNDDAFQLADSMNFMTEVEAARSRAARASDSRHMFQVSVQSRGASSGIKPFQ